MHRLSRFLGRSSTSSQASQATRRDQGSGFFGSLFGGRSSRISQSSQRPTSPKGGEDDEEDSEKDDEEEEEEESEESEPDSEEEELNEEELKPAGSEVEQIRLPDTIKQRYVFLDLLHDSGHGCRVYLCIDSLWEPPQHLLDQDDGPRRIGVHGKHKVEEMDKELRAIQAEKEKKSGAKFTGSIKVKKKPPRRKCVMKVWEKRSRPKEIASTWLETQLKLLGMERHPNLQLPRKIMEDEHAYYVDFDCVLVGASLMTMILGDASLTERMVKKIIKGILRGLSHLHDNKLVHRDIKPDNVLLEWQDAGRLLAKNQRLPKGYLSSKEGTIRWKEATHFKSSWTRHELIFTVRIIDFDTCEYWDPNAPPPLKDGQHGHHGHHHHHHHDHHGHQENPESRENTHDDRENTQNSQETEQSSKDDARQSSKGSKDIDNNHDTAIPPQPSMSDHHSAHHSHGQEHHHHHHHHHHAQGPPVIICGTPGFMAPEAYIKNAGICGDLFGVGMILHLLVGCSAPCHDAVHRILRGESFEHATFVKREQLQKGTVTAIQAIDWTVHPWDQLTLCRDFCRSLIHVTPSSRGGDAGDVIRITPWFHKKKAVSSEDKLALAALASLTSDDHGDVVADDKKIGEEAIETMPEVVAARSRRGGIMFAVPGHEPTEAELVAKRQTQAAMKASTQTANHAERAGSVRGTRAAFNQGDKDTAIAMKFAAEAAAADAEPG